MKIISWNDCAIDFSDGSYICFDHCPDCCESNYADFSILPQFYHGEEFTKVSIEAKEEGFLLHLHGVPQFEHFGETMKIWIPCYSEQNGYYATDLDIYYCNKDEYIIQEISLDCEFMEA